MNNIAEQHLYFAAQEAERAAKHRPALARGCLQAVRTLAMLCESTHAANGCHNVARRLEEVIDAQTRK